MPFNPLPISLCDLDDTVFQTPRKMTAAQLQTARRGASDSHGQVRSYMRQDQAAIVDWLNNSTELIPVTARGTEQLSRVHIDFRSYQIATHGAVILQPDGRALPTWQEKICDELATVAPQLQRLQRTVAAVLAKPSHYGLSGLDAWCRMNREYATDIYLVTKVTQSANATQLAALEAWVAEELGIEEADSGLYVHRNGNNLAWIPRCIGKAQAVTYLLTSEASLRERPVIGFGDSLSDWPFMALCSFAAIAANSQLSRLTEQGI